jgi:hypothetical protein
MRQEYFDEVSLEYFRAEAAKLRADPALFDAVRDNLRRWRQRVEAGGTMEKRYLEQWESLANTGMEACLALASDRSEWAVAMRHTAPFEGLLTQDEREAVRTRVLVKHRLVRA